MRSLAHHRAAQSGELPLQIALQGGASVEVVAALLAAHPQAEAEVDSVEHRVMLERAKAYGESSAATKRLRSPARVGAAPCWERKFSELNFGRILGSGSTGEVFAVDCSGLPMAAKKIHFLEPSQRKEAEKRLRREFRALNKLNHENVLQVMGVVVDQSDAVYLLTELMHQSLRHLLDQEPTRITENPGARVKVLTGVVNGMNHLHEQNMLHHNLKSKNLLLTSSLDVKISDFGIDCAFTGSSTPRQPGITDTHVYMAPELWEGNSPEFTRECDVYAFGLIFWELLTGGRPWDGKSELALCRALLKQERPPLTDEQKKDYVGSIVCRCWAQDPASRPTFQQLLREIRVYQARASATVPGLVI